MSLECKVCTQSLRKTDKGKPQCTLWGSRTSGSHLSLYADVNSPPRLYLTTRAGPAPCPSCTTQCQWPHLWTAYAHVTLTHLYTSNRGFRPAMRAVAPFTSSELYHRPTILLVKLNTPWPGPLQQTCPTPLQLEPLTCLRIEASRASGLQTSGTCSTACTLFICFLLLFLKPAAQYSVHSTAWGLNSMPVGAPQSPYTFQSPSSSSPPPHFSVRTEAPPCTSTGARSSLTAQRTSEQTRQQAERLMGRHSLETPKKQLGSAYSTQNERQLPITSLSS